MRRLILLSLASCLSLLTSCGDAEPSGPPQSTNTASLGLGLGQTRPARSPGQVLDAFFEAIVAGDAEAYEGLMTSAAVEALHADGDSSMSFESDKVGSWEIGAQSIDGDQASVAVTLKQDGEEQALALKLRNERNHWRIYGMAIPMGEEEWLIDFEGGDDSMSQMGEELASGLAEAFEGAAGDWETGGSPEQIAAARVSFGALAAVKEEQHDATWQVGVEAGGRAAAEVIAELLIGTGLSANCSEEFDQILSLSMSGSSRLAAIEAVCAAVGMLPVYPSSGVVWGGGESELAFRAGQRTLPVTFDGPFMIEVDKLEEDAPNSVGEVAVTVRALGLHPSVLAANEQMGQILALSDISSQAQTSLLADPEIQWMGSPTITGGLFSYSHSSDLAGLLRSVESLTIGGEVILQLPVEVHTSSFEACKAHATAAAGPWTVTWDKFGADNSFSLTNSNGSDAGPIMRFAPDLASGQPMGIQSESSSGFAGQISATVSLPSAPTSLAFKIIESRELRYAFKIDGIQLERFAEQPAHLLALSFPGSAPLEVEVKGFGDRSNPDFPKISLRVTNSANLGVADAQVTFLYLDAAGKVLEDFPHTLSGEFTFEGSQPLADVDASSDMETVAFFMPAQTKTVRARVESVSFVNGTSWERK